jgi:hypothetical protein
VVLFVCSFHHDTAPERFGLDYVWATLEDRFAVQEGAAGCPTHPFRPPPRQRVPHPGEARVGVFRRPEGSSISESNLLDSHHRLALQRHAHDPLQQEPARQHPPRRLRRARRLPRHRLDFLLARHPDRSGESRAVGLLNVIQFSLRLGSRTKLQIGGD